MPACASGARHGPVCHPCSCAAGAPASLARGARGARRRHPSHERAASMLGARARAQAAVQKPFEARLPEGRARLVALLRQVMIRAAKADLVTLPRLEYKARRGRG